MADGVPLEVALLISVATFAFALAWSYLMASRVAPPRAKRLIVDTLRDGASEEVVAIRAALIAPELVAVDAALEAVRADFAAATKRLEDLAGKALTLDFFLSEDPANQAVLADVTMSLAAALQLRIGYETSAQGQQGPTPLLDFFRTWGTLMSASLHQYLEAQKADPEVRRALSDASGGGSNVAKLAVLIEAAEKAGRPMSPETRGRMESLAMVADFLAGAGGGKAVERRKAAPGGGSDFYG